MTVPSQAEETMKKRVARELPHIHSDLFGEIIGFMLGDGHLREERNEFSFVNSEIYCISRILEDFEVVFGLDRNSFYYWLIVPFGSDISGPGSLWKDALKLKNPIKVYIDKNKKTKKENGILHVRKVDSKITTKISLTCASLTHIKNKDFILGFIRGFFAAEGAVIPGKERKDVPNSIQLPQKGRDIPILIRDYLKDLGIESRVVVKQKKANYYCTNITAHENFSKFLALGLADMHPVKKEKISFGLNSYISIKSRRGVTSLKLLSFISENYRSRKEIYSYMGKSEQQINEMLYSKNKSFLLRKGLIVRGIIDGQPKWSITALGQEYLSCIKPKTGF